MVINIPDASCLGDMNDDGEVNITDLLGVISEWGNPYDVSDLLMVIEKWGSACEQPGACCLPTGGCESTDESGCEDAGGVWNGTGTFCSIVDCPDYGACCWDDESCTLELSDACKTGGGSFRRRHRLQHRLHHPQVQRRTPRRCRPSMVRTPPRPSTRRPAATRTPMRVPGTYGHDACRHLVLLERLRGSLVSNAARRPRYGSGRLPRCDDMTQIACNGDNSTCSGYSPGAGHGRAVSSASAAGREQHRHRHPADQLRLGGWCLALTPARLLHPLHAAPHFEWLLTAEGRNGPHAPQERNPARGGQASLTF